MSNRENPMAPQNATGEEQRTLATFRVGLSTGIIFFVIAIASTISTISTGINAYGGIILVGIVSALGFLSAYLSRQGRALLGSGILVSAILVLSLSLPVIAKGQGIALAVLVMVITTSIASATLPSKWALRAGIASILIALIIIFADLYGPSFGIPNDPSFTYIIAAIAAIIYSWSIVSRFSTYVLRTKLVIAFILVTLFPLAGLGVYNNFITREVLKQQAQSDLGELVTKTMIDIDSYLDLQLDTFRTEAQQPTIVNYLKTPTALRPGSFEEEQADLSLRALLRKDTVFILSYSILDRTGRNLLDTVRDNIGDDESQTEYFLASSQSGLPYVSNIAFEQDETHLHFIAPIRDSQGEVLGYLRAEYSALILQQILLDALPENQGQLMILLDRETFLRIAYTGNRELLYKSYKNLADAEISRLQASGRLPKGDREQVISSSDEFVNGVENLGETPFFTSESGSLDGAALTTGANSELLPWILVARQSEDVLFAPIEEQTRTLILASLLVLSLSASAAFWVAQVISRPVVNLANVARKITEGDLAARAEVKTGDEVGDLASIFNNMTSELRQTLVSLEQRVAERTTDLELANLQTEKRARDLQTIADVSRAINREQNLEKLLPLVTDLVSDRFNFYHVGIFLVDDARRAAVLQASNSPGGMKMLANGHRIELGTAGIVGYVALTGKPRIALDVGADAVFFNNPLLPETRSEMALPLLVSGVAIGVLDVQSKQARAFTEADASTLAVLADQIAIAIQNARLVRQTRAALVESQSIIQTFLSQEWKAQAQQKPTVGYIKSPSGGRTLDKPVESDEIRLALRKNSSLNAPQRTRKKDAAANLTIPIKLGEQVLGAIRIQSQEKDHEWSPDEMTLVQNISDRVALALENARLIESSQKRAAKERVIGNIAAKISANTNIDDILKTALSELKQTVSASEIFVKIGNNSATRQGSDTNE